MVLLLTLKGFFFLLIHLMKTVFINHSNLRSGVIFFFCFFASLAREGKNSALLPKTDYRDKGRGHDRRLQSHLQGKPTHPPALPSKRRLLVPMRPKIHVAAPFPRQKKNVRVRVRIHVGYRERTGREVTSVHDNDNETGTKV